MESLSPGAIKTINDYLSLPFPGTSGVRCPYFNNAKSRQRGQLSVLIGKGSPRDIVEEAKIISLQYHKNLFNHDGGCCLHDGHASDKNIAEDIRQFLIDNNLGADCSGFVTRVLARHFADTKKINLLKKMFIVSPARLLRWLIARLRPMENIGARAYASDKNTTKVKLTQARPGDVVVMMETGPKHERNHILVITETDKGVIRYASSRAWSAEGKYGHGVAVGEIRVTNPKAGLLDQEWVELGKTGEANGTYLEAKQARILEIRRLKF